MGIFSLTVITILFAIVRIALIPNKDSAADVTWLCLWAHVETGVGTLDLAHIVLPHFHVSRTNFRPVS